MTSKTGDTRQGSSDSKLGVKVTVTPRVSRRVAKKVEGADKKAVTSSHSQFSLMRPKRDGLTPEKSKQSLANF